MTPVRLVVLSAVLLGLLRIWSFRQRGEGVLRALGLSPLRPADAAAGVVIASLGIGAVFVAAYVTGAIRVTGIGSRSALYGDLTTYVMVPLVEELVFRTGLLGGLLVLVPARRWLAIGASAAVFGGLHLLNANATALAALGSTLGGVAYGIAFAETKGLWMPVGLHFGWNYVQGPVLGFALSGGRPLGGTLLLQEDVGPAWFTGGAYGPEAGVVGMVGRILVLALLLGWIRTRDPQPGSDGLPHRSPPAPLRT